MQFVINSGYGGGIAAEDYEIAHFNDKNAEVGNYSWNWSFSYSIKVILNSTEWEVTLHLEDFDESWMRYVLGRGSYTIVLNSRFFEMSNQFFLGWIPRSVQHSVLINRNKTVW